MNKELKIGFVAVLSIAILFIGVNYLKGLSILNAGRTFYAKYENIGGLKVGSSISVNGYKIGMVSNIDLLANENKKLLVTGKSAFKPYKRPVKSFNANRKRHASCEE